ncbi:hypothetical protein TRFO_06410 [Tritrichomonas foetus]|uniref:Uncharacterized protein n=1 Tax=Tritrichomonas foetus TaxID=1144522 RepID=A0A1J4K3Q2_9EUKA|nr:hypothetical protein TRFO_06410 [Tritrichomonas foetus]|eukprot:OHT04109.1 hypothetical protein TRFO_06410 [Tritrichomonas foetus]
MSSSLQASTGSYRPSKSFMLNSPVQPAIRSKKQSQDLRKQLRSKMVDLGNIQSDWSVQESNLRNKAEDLITQLRNCQRQFDATKKAEKVKHLQMLDQINRQHQIVVMDLQAQIDDCLDGQEEIDDLADIEQEIENVKIQITGFQKVQMIEDEEEEQEDFEHVEKIEMLEKRLIEMQSIFQKAVQQREEESRTSTQKLEELILRQQDIDDQNHVEFQRLVDNLNNLDREQALQIATIEKQLQENKRHLSNNLKSAINKAADLQQKITKYQHDHKKEMKHVIDEETGYRNLLETLNARHRGHLEESMNAARKCSEEKRRFAAMQHEVEELNGELVRETIEHETLIKEVNRMDNEVLNQMSRGVSDPSLSFTFNRF